MPLRHFSEVCAYGLYGVKSTPSRDVARLKDEIKQIGLEAADHKQMSEHLKRTGATYWEANIKLGLLDY